MTPSGRLEGLGVLVTRPAQQAEPLCRLLALEGAQPIRFPTLEIRPIEPPHIGEAASIRAGDFALVIFSSVNAVRFGAGLLAKRSGLELAAIGPATVRALNEAGHGVAVAPAGGFDSESLLQHPRLLAVAGERILLIKGAGGRELLREELERRGAGVTVAEVYRRERAQASASEVAGIERALAADALHALTVTSVEIGVGLLDLATPVLRAGFDRLPWVVPGERVAASLRARGVGAPFLAAASAQDQHLLAALVRWRAGESGA